MCLADTPSYTKAPAPAGAGFTVADVDTGSSKYTKVYDDKQNDVTDSVEYDSSTSKYKKKQTTNSAVDAYASA